MNLFRIYDFFNILYNNKLIPKYSTLKKVIKNILFNWFVLIPNSQY
jgi:hypothetical protein